LAQVVKEIMLSIVIPVYKNEGSIQLLVDKLGELAAQLTMPLEVVFTVDGSPDRSHHLLREALPAARFQSQLLLLSRNFGSFAAIRAGLNAAHGDYFAVMAADLQEPPELAAQMLQAMLDKPLDVVVGVRESRDDPWLSRLPAAMFWGLYRRFVVRDVPPGGVDVFGCNRAFRDSLLQLNESHSSLIAQIFWIGFRRETIRYTRLAREHGKSAWTLKKKLDYFFDSIFAFTDLPIRLLVRGGALGVLASLLYAFVLILGRIFYGTPVQGYTATILVIIFFGTLNLMALGIVGSYAWRAFENTKARPLNIVLSKESFTPPQKGTQ
jgi:polyisoprenyl-phosphate glycosyltransferase